MPLATEPGVSHGILCRKIPQSHGAFLCMPVIERHLQVAAVHSVHSKKSLFSSSEQSVVVLVVVVIFCVEL